MDFTESLQSKMHFADLTEEDSLLQNLGGLPDDSNTNQHELQGRQTTFASKTQMLKFNTNS